jgi:ABC-2 type transport system ATP-binding protein
MKNEKKPIIQVKNLTVSFNGFIAVDNVSFEVCEGEVLGLLGGNGAGKSTTLKVLGGVLKPSSGSVYIDGLDLSSMSDVDMAKYITGYCPDVGGIINGATPREHIKLLLTLHKKPFLYDEGIKLIEMFGLSDFIDTPSSGFSHGMSRRLSVLLATLASVKVLVLDEPFDGVDPLGVQAINETIRQAKEAGLAVIISTHLQDLLVEVSDRIIIMKESEIIAGGKASRFRGRLGRRLYRVLLENHAKGKNK